MFIHVCIQGRDSDIKTNMNLNPNEQKAPLVRVWHKVQRLPLGRSHRRTQGSTCNWIRCQNAYLSNAKYHIWIYWIYEILRSAFPPGNKQVKVIISPLCVFLPFLVNTKSSKQSKPCNMQYIWQDYITAELREAPWRLASPLFGHCPNSD